MKLYDEEIEYALLGGLIANCQVLPLLDVKEDYFAVDINQRIFKTMKTLYAEKQNFDRAALVLALAGKDIRINDENINVQDYLSDLMQSVITSNVSSLEAYAAALRGLALKRHVHDGMTRIIDRIGDMATEDVTAELSNLILHHNQADKIQSEAEVREKIVEAMSRPANCYKTGLPDLDQAMSGGLFAGYTYGIAGAEKAGKTTFAHTISHNLALAGHKHLYVALEMGSMQIEQRNLARTIGVNSMRFIDKPGQIASAVMGATITGCKFFYDAPGASVHDILAKAKAAQIKHGIVGFIVDYWQLVEGKDPRESEERHLRFVAQTLANFARKSGMWCILLAQLNKEGQLFGGNGLRKACDQLYFIEQTDIVNFEQMRWLRMDASRYTPRQDIGNNTDLPFELNRTVGPFIENRNVFFRKKEDLKGVSQKYNKPYTYDHVAP